MVRLDGIMIWVEDVAASVAFYERAFDLAASEVDLDNGFAMISTGGVDLQLADERAAERTGVTVRPNRLDQPEPPGCQLALVADDVDAAYAKAVDAGAEAVVPLAAKP